MISKIQLANVNSKNKQPYKERNNFNAQNPICQGYPSNFVNAYPTYSNHNSQKKISFSGNYNPLINYLAPKTAILRHDFELLNILNDEKSTVSEYVSKTIKKIFSTDNESPEKPIDAGINVLSQVKDYYENLINIGDNKSGKNATRILKYLNTNLISIKKNYLVFSKTILQPLKLVAKGEQEFSPLFLQEKLGDEDLAEFWLKKLQFNETPNSDREKVDLLNNRLRELYKNGGEYSSELDTIEKDTMEQYFLNEIKKQDLPILKKVIKIEQPKLETLEEIKGKLDELVDSSNRQKEKFIDFINNENNLKTNINGTTVEDILLSILEKDGIDVKDLSATTQKEYLTEIANDDNLRKESIVNAITIIRKAQMSKKVIVEKLMLAKTTIEGGDLKNFDQELLATIFVQNNSKNANQILNDIKLFEREANAAFMKLIPQEPFNSANSTAPSLKENSNIVLSLINERLISSKEKEETKRIYRELEWLESAISFKDYQEANKAWQKLIQTSMIQWNEKHLPAIVQKQQQSYIDVQNFLKSDFAKEVEDTGIINTLFKSETITIEEKAYLVQRLESENIRKTGQDLCKFLVKDLPNNKARKRVINNLIENEQIANETFDYLQTEFINIIRNQDVKNPLKSARIQEESILDLFMKQTSYANSLYSMSPKEKLSILNQYPDKELNILAQKIKDKYLIEKSIEAFEEESTKYDLANRIDDVMKNLQVEVDGKKYNLFEIMTDENKQLAKLINESKDISQEKMDQVIALLGQNNKDGKEMRAILGSILDKVQVIYPHYAPQCKQARTFMQKIKDGLLSDSSVDAGTMAAVLLAAKSGVIVGSTGGPIGAAGGATLAMLATATLRLSRNVYRSFSKK